MATLRLPPEVEAVFREFRTCEFTAVNRQDQPLTWPTEPYYNATEGRLIVTSSIAFPVKAYNARRHPQVAMLFSDPTGAPLTNPPTVLVQGDATVTELVDDPAWSYAMFKESILRQPRTRSFVGNPLARWLFTFFSAWQFSCNPGVSSSGRGATGVSFPPNWRCAMWNKTLIAYARVYPSGVLTVVENSGYPWSVRCIVEFDDARELILFPTPPPDVVGRQGWACLLFHRHDAELGGQHELLIKGELGEEAGVLLLRPGDFLTGSGRQDTDRMPVAGSPLDILRFMMLGRRKAREYLARRGKPWTPRPWGKMLRYLDEP